jgi:hypothetical protein
MTRMQLPVRTGFILLILGLALSGCSIKQTVDPFDEVGSGFEVCIIEDDAVRDGFLAEYKSSLIDKGIPFRILSEHGTVQDCPVVSTYTARWSWDMTIYMSYAVIKVYELGDLKGEAIYDSRGGGFRLDKWKDAEGKIRELVDELFPT